MEEIMKMILEALIPILGALLTALSSYAISLLAKRFKVRLDAEQQLVLRSAIRKAVAGAEEWAARTAKVESNPISGARKAQWVHERVKVMFPNLASDELDQLIDEELAQLVGVGSTGEKALEI